MMSGGMIEEDAQPQRLEPRLHSAAMPVHSSLASAMGHERRLEGRPVGSGLPR